MRWLLCLALVACKKDSGPSCEQVVDHMLEVTKQQMIGHDDVKLDHQKAAMVDQCKKRDMSAETRTCLMDAKTISDIAKCRGAASNVNEKPRRPRPPTGATAHGPLPGSGSGTPTMTGSGSATSTGSGSGSGSAK